MGVGREVLVRYRRGLMSQSWGDEDPRSALSKEVKEEKIKTH